MEQKDDQEVGRRVVCSAMVHRDGRMILSPRHFDSTVHKQLELLALQGEDVMQWGSARQGFVDQQGVFMTREEALVVAKKQGQIIRRVGGDDLRLFSENLY